MSGTIKSPEQGYINDPKLVAERYLRVVNPSHLSVVEMAAGIVNSMTDEEAGYQSYSISAICGEVARKLGSVAQVITTAIVYDHYGMPENWRNDSETTRTVLTIAGHLAIGSQRAFQVEVPTLLTSDRFQAELEATEVFVRNLQAI